MSFHTHPVSSKLYESGLNSVIYAKKNERRKAGAPWRCLFRRRLLFIPPLLLIPFKDLFRVV